MKWVHGLAPEMKAVQYVREIRNVARGKRQDLLEASEWYLGAQGRRLSREYRDAPEDPGGSEESWLLFTNTKTSRLNINV